MILRFLKGFRAPFSGFRLMISDPSLWRLATIPYIIDLVLFSVGVYYGQKYIPGIVSAYVKNQTLWQQFLYYPVLALTFIVSFILLFTCVFFLTNLIAAPFNAVLAERTLIIEKALSEKRFQVGRWIKVSGRMLLVSLMKAAIFVSVGVVLFFFGLVPGLNVAAAFAGLLIMSFDCADYSFESFEMGLRERLRFHRSHLAEFSGFGCALGLTFLIPGLNFLLYPATVVGAAQLVADIRRQLDPGPRS
ncbi:MAG TPA: EI24 domain-containing protein [Bdellovibrionales bacterium]|nr:EI24 domain-containing protein [Bdellovibrionales bacterium]